MYLLVSYYRENQIIMTLKKKLMKSHAAAIQIFLWLFQVRPLPDLWFRSSLGRRHSYLFSWME